MFSNALSNDLGYAHPPRSLELSPFSDGSRCSGAFFLASRSFKL